ncbi:MAG: hypothetical protein AAF902_04035 [Chloroflexota bacterium]
MAKSSNESSNNKSNFSEHLEKRLKRAAYRMNCPSHQTLLAYTWNLLPENESKAVSLHLDSCPHCPKEISEFEDYFSKQAHEEAKSQRIPSRRTTLFPRFISVVSPALRSGKESPKFPLLYSLEEQKINISINAEKQAPGQFKLVGQLLGELDQLGENVNIQLLSSNPSNSVDGTNLLLQPDGYFEFTNVSVGDYAFLISSAIFEFSITDLTLGDG